MRIAVNANYHMPQYHHVVLDVLRHVKTHDNAYYYLALDSIDPYRTDEFYFQDDEILYQHPEFSLPDGGHPDKRLGLLWLSPSEASVIPGNNRNAADLLSNNRWKASDFE